MRLTHASINPHWARVVNLSNPPADPIRLTTQREEFLVRPAGLSPAHGEVYAIQRVEAISRGTSKRFVIQPFYDFGHVGGAGDQVFYTTHIRPSVVGEGADIAISFGTPEDAGG